MALPLLWQGLTARRAHARREPTLERIERTTLRTHLSFGNMGRTPARTGGVSDDNPMASIGELARHQTMISLYCSATLLLLSLFIRVDTTT